MRGIIPAQAPYEGGEPTMRKGSYSEELVKGGITQSRAKTYFSTTSGGWIMSNSAVASLPAKVKKLPTHCQDAGKRNWTH